MSNKDFQNGFALGLASGGVVTKKVFNYTADSAVEIIEPININNNIVINSGVVATATAVIKE